MRGYDLVALIFTREINDGLTGLVKKIDARLDETMARDKRPNRLGVFVILLTPDPAGQLPRLKSLAEKEGLKQVVLSAFQNTAGPPRYKVAREAGHTVAVYGGSNQVSANFALDPGDIGAAKADAIFKAVTAVLPPKK